MSVVYIVHEAVFNNRPVKDTTAAEEFGERRVLIRTSGRSKVLLHEDGSVRRPKNPDADFMAGAVEAISEGLIGITEDDYLLPVGSVKMIAVAAAIAARNTDGLLRLLIWNERDERYEAVEEELWEPEEEEVNKMWRSMEDDASSVRQEP